MSRVRKTQKSLEKENLRVVMAPPMSGRYSRKEGPAIHKPRESSSKRGGGKK